MTTSITDEALAAIKAGLEGGASTMLMPSLATVASMIARIEQAEAARSEAIRLMSEASREAGEWKGRYKAAGHPDTLDGLIDRAEKAEARARALEEALTPSG